MFTLRNLAVVAFSLVSLTALGCAATGTSSSSSSGKPSANAMAGKPSDTAVYCDKCKVTWVKGSEAGYGRGSVQGYSARKQMVCPECKDAVANMFTTGKLEHTCTACGGNMSGCAVH